MPNRSNAPPEHPLPRICTLTEAKPSSGASAAADGGRRVGLRQLLVVGPEEVAGRGAVP